MSSPAPVLGFRDALKFPAVTRLWIAQIVSIFGDFLAVFAVFSVVTFQLHGTPTQVSMILAAYLAPVALDIQRARSAADEEWIHAILSLEEQSKAFKVWRFELVYGSRSRPSIRILGQELTDPDARVARYRDYVFSTGENMQASLGQFRKVLNTKTAAKSRPSDPQVNQARSKARSNWMLRLDRHLCLNARITFSDSRIIQLSYVQAHLPRRFRVR